MWPNIEKNLDAPDLDMYLRSWFIWCKVYKGGLCNISDDVKSQCTSLTVEYFPLREATIWGTDSHQAHTEAFQAVSILWQNIKITSYFSESHDSCFLAISLLISAVSFSILRISNLISCSFSIISKRRWCSRSFICKVSNVLSSLYEFTPATWFVFSSAAKETIMRFTSILWITVKLILYFTQLLLFKFCKELKYKLSHAWFYSTKWK